MISVIIDKPDCWRSRTTVKGAPHAVTIGLSPVENDHVVVQLWIAVSRIEVGEARGDDANDVLFYTSLLS